jgi:hypothetical protein
VLFASYYLDNVGFTGYSAPYDPELHRWWRIRDHLGRTYWETSPDGTSWTTRYDVPNPTPVTALDVQLAVGCDSGCTASTVRFDNYNLPP